MKITAISDLHGYLPEIETCDIVCICGDILPLGIDRNFDKSEIWFKHVFIPWTLQLPCDHVVFIAGNHDFFFEKLTKSIIDSDYIKEHTDKLIYLCDDLVELKGIKIYGTPWVPVLYNWAFYKSDEELYEKYNEIPDDIDILLTHCPAYNYNLTGVVLQNGNWNYMRELGSFELFRVLEKRNNIKYHFSGHIHTGNHKLETVGTLQCANVSIKDENYNVSFKPLTIEIQ